MWAVIGGSGFESFAGFEAVEALKRETPFGSASSGLKAVRMDGRDFIFLSRHGEQHELLPSEINYRANIFALKAQGVNAVVSFSAVGSLRAGLEPEHLIIPMQYIDRTKGIRKHSFCGEGVVGHMSLAHPVCEIAARRVAELAKHESFTSHLGGTYVCIEGPNFSTYAESISYRDIGADIVGMTQFPEYALAREAGLAYVPCCFVTDYDCWDMSRPHVTLDQVIAIMKRNNAKAFALFKRILSSPTLLDGCECQQQGFRTGLMVSKERLTPQQREWVDVLLS